MSALALEDYFKPFFKEGLSDRASNIIMRGTVLILGAVSVGLVYVVERLGSVLQLSMSVPAACAGSVFGLFTIGMFLPWIGKRAAFYGAVTASAVMMYIVVRSQLEMANGLIRYDTKVTSVEGCSYNYTISDQTPETLETFERQFHHISYLYYMPMGAVITCMAAFIFSLLFGFEASSNVDPRLLAPFVRKYFKSSVTEHVFDNKDGMDAIMIKFEMKNNQLE